MKGWFKRFSLSLFSAEQARENVRYGFGNILLTGVLSVIFLFLGIFAGGTVPFFAYYNGADEFREFLYNAFTDSGTGITLTVKGGGAEIKADGKDVLINTFIDGDDRAAYFVNGYHLIVDSRKVASVYDDFTAYCVSTDGKKEITYEDYLNLSGSDKAGYIFTVKYSGKEKVIGETEIAAYTEYFNGVSEESVKKQYNALLDKKDGLSAEEFNKSLYALYVGNYYPDMLRVVGESVPSLRNYYYSLTLQSENKYFCLFGDMQTASFRSYNGNTVACGGVYRKGVEINTAGLDGVDAQREIDNFIKAAYYGGLSSSFILEMLNSLFLVVIVELIIIGAMTLCYAVGKLKKSEFCSTFAKSAKLVASYSHTAALFAAVSALCFGFIISGTAVAVVAYVVFAAILIARTLTLTLCEKQNKQVSE